MDPRVIGEAMRGDGGQDVGWLRMLSRLVRILYIGLDTIFLGGVFLLSTRALRLGGRVSVRSQVAITEVDFIDGVGRRPDMADGKSTELDAGTIMTRGGKYGRR